jgi:hypothetical protein
MNSQIIVRVVAGLLCLVILAVIAFRRNHKNAV